MDLHLNLDRLNGRLSAQVAAGLRGAIRDGRLSAATRLPSSRDLARDLDVSRGVVVSAYEQLIAEGFLTARRGDGTRVAPLARPEASPQPWGVVRPAAEPPVHGRYDLRPGHPDLSAFPREQWAAAIRTTLRAIPHGELAYPDPAGVAALRTELAGYLGRVRAANAEAHAITITNGVAQGLFSLARILVEQGHRILAIEEPTSDRQLPTLRASGAELVRVPVDHEGIDVAALARTGARAVLITPAHQYPTGVVLSPRRRAELIAWARDVAGVILEDDYDAEFRYDREPVGCLQGVAPEHVVLLGSVSKALAPALRLGWALAPPMLAERLWAYRAHTDLGSPVLDQHALAHLIASGGYDRHLRTMRRRYRARRDLLAEAVRVHVPGAVVQGVSAGLHLYVELPPGCDEDKVVTEAAHRGVALKGAASSWSRPAPPALVLGYSRLNESGIAEAVRILGQVITRGDVG